MNVETLADILRNLYAIEITASVMMDNPRHAENIRKILILVLHDMAVQLDRFENELSKAGIKFGFNIPKED